MIQLLSWNIPSLPKNELLRWKNWFISKHGEIGVTHFIWNDFELQSIRDTLFSRSFFTQKKLLILEDISLALDGVEELFDILQSKDADTIVLIVLYQVDKRLSSYKKLIKIVTEHKDFTISDNDSAIAFLRKDYAGNFEPGALEYLFEYKWNKLEKTMSEINKLLETYDYVSKDIIRQLIIPELDSSIFRLIDLLLQKQSKWFFAELELLVTNESFYLVSQTLLSNLRNNIYIEYLKLHIPPQQIWDILNLWKKSFLVTKRHNTTYAELHLLYKTLVRFDSSMKQWKLWVSTEDDIVHFYKAGFLSYFSESRSLW